MIGDRDKNILNVLNLETLSNEYMLNRNALFGDIYDDDYNLIQNETLQSNYKGRYGGLENVKTYIDNVGWERIDISSNPGRRIYKTGYVESVASTMWLSDTFFELTGADKQKLNELEWLQVEQLSDTVIKITSWPEPFNSAEGEQGRRQIELRKILYPNSKD